MSNKYCLCAKCTAYPKVIIKGWKGKRFRFIVRLKFAMGRYK